MTHTDFIIGAYPAHRRFTREGNKKRPISGVNLPIRHTCAALNNPYWKIFTRMGMTGCFATLRQVAHRRNSRYGNDASAGQQRRFWPGLSG